MTGAFGFGVAGTDGHAANGNGTLGATRWRPTRAGLVNVWRFEDETFEFHRGRLLLRGPNGAGKSMALELLFPFLLDANASPFRLTSGVKDRGGLYERVMTGTDAPTRVGFAWGEFRRGEEVVTIGVRLRASVSTGKAEVDWFTSRQSVGVDLALLDADRIPLAKAALDSAVGEGGKVHDSAADYRDTVRRLLFQGFSPAQYDALVTALLALRREKISQDLSPAKLSEVLTASLPSLDEKDVSEIAEGFERLDRRRDELARLESDLAQVRDLARRQREYARRVVVSAANGVRGAESKRDEVTRREREARTELGVAGERREACRAEASTAGRRVAELEAEIETLRNLDAYREGAQLEDLQRQRSRLARQVEDEERAVAARRDVLEAAARERDRARERLAARRAETERAGADLRAAAETLGAAQAVAEALDFGDPDEAEGMLAAWASARRTQLAEVQAALRALEERIRARDTWDHLVDDERARVQELAGQREAAEAATDEAAAAYRRDVRAWIEGCELLEASQLATEIPAPPDDPPAVTAAIARVAGSAVASIAGERARLEATLEGLSSQMDELAAERAELAAGRTPEPDAPPWRTLRDRPGSPLWRLVDFAGHCPPAERDGIEAALLASGLLDAWVGTDGSVDLPEHAADALADAGGPPAPGESLLEVLIVLQEAEVPAEVVVGVLGRIGLVDGDAGVAAGVDAAVGRDGSFRLGVLAGRGPAQPARFIGAAAQERERARRIAQLDAEIAVLASRAHRLSDDIEALERRRRGIEAEVALSPDGAALLEARREWELVRVRFADAEGRLRSAELQRLESEQAVRKAQAALMHLATRHGLPTDAEGIRAYEVYLGAFESATATWARRSRGAAQAGQELAICASATERAEAELAEAARRFADVDQQRREVVVRLETLESSVGAAYRDVVARVEAARAKRHGLEGRQVELADERAALERQIGALEERVADAQQRRASAEAERDSAHASFLAVVADGYGDDTGADLSFDGTDTATGILEAARAVAARFPTVDAEPPALTRAQNSVMEGYHVAGQTLRGRVDLTFEQTETGFWLLRAATDGVRSRVPQLVRRMSDQVALAAEELTDEERRLFDETLTGSLRAAVAERIRQANHLIDGINLALASVRTDAAGVGVRLRWDVDPDQPHASRSVRALLLKSAADYTDSERAALHEFFRGRLDQVRAELEGSSGWEERLREVLDYRRWHTFSLEVAHQDWEGFQPATAGRLQRLSTGERSIALHLPMLASITAHYDGSAADAAPACPRLILLDELFAGVDQTNRGQLFGLFVAWDLDAIFTSDHEWCAYSGLDGIAIHHLHGGGAGEPAVSSRFVWNGRRRVPAPVGSEGPG